MKSFFQTILIYAVTSFTAFFVFAQEFFMSPAGTQQAQMNDLSKLEVPPEDDPAFRSDVTIAEHDITEQNSNPASSFSVQQVKQKTNEVFQGIVSGDINATEPAEKFDSFLSATFMRIRDSWFLCKQEFALAQEAAVLKAQKTQEQLENKLQNTIDAAKQQYVDGVLDGTSTVKTNIEGMIQNSIDSGTQAINQMTEKASSAKTQISDKVNELKESGIQRYESIKDTSIEKYETMRNSSKEAWNGLKDSTVQQIDAIKSSTSSIMPTNSSSSGNTSAVQP